jgi:Family of unknown function (DUF6524)
MFESFGIQRFITRWLAAMFLVLATYNPSGYSYYHWVSELDIGNWILKLLAAVALAILYAMFGLATRRSLGRLGIAAWLVFFAVVIWIMIDVGLIRIAGSGTVVTIVLGPICWPSACHGRMCGPDCRVRRIPTTSPCPEPARNGGNRCNRVTTARCRIRAPPPQSAPIQAHTAASIESGRQLFCGDRGAENRVARSGKPLECEMRAGLPGGPADRRI